MNNPLHVRTALRAAFYGSIPPPINRCTPTSKKCRAVEQMTDGSGNPRPDIYSNCNTNGWIGAGAECFATTPVKAACGFVCGECPP